MVKLWILGKKGLVGSALQNLCEERAIACLATSHEEADVTSLEKLQQVCRSKRGGVTHIINCAAFTDVDRAEKEVEQAYLVNAKGPENVAILAQEMGAGLTHISSDYVFGDHGRSPYVEIDECRPSGVYAESKWEGENRLLDRFPRASIVRTSWVFGKGGKNFISTLMKKLQEQEVLYAASDQRGRPTFVTDLAEAILALLCYPGIYHFANRGEASRFDVAQKIFAFAQKQNIPLLCKEVIPVLSSDFPTPCKRPLYSVLSTCKVEKLFPFPPRHWEEALPELCTTTS